MMRKAQITENFISVDDLMKEAVAVWDKFKDPATYDEETTRTKIAEMRRTHGDFMTSHQIIGIYIAQLGWFSRRAVKKYGEHILAHPWKSLDNMIDSQVIYGVTLHKIYNKKCSQAKLMQVKTSIRATLKEEYESNVELCKILQEGLSKFNEKAAAQRQRETEVYCSMFGKEIVDIPIVADLSGLGQVPVARNMPFVIAAPCDLNAFDISADDLLS